MNFPNIPHLPEEQTFSHSLQRFCKAYDARVKNGPPMQQLQPVSFQSIIEDDWRSLPAFVSSFDITLSEESLKALLSTLDRIDSLEFQEFRRLTQVMGNQFITDLYATKAQTAREQRARKENPAVQKAWENYQLMLKLSRS